MPNENENGEYRIGNQGPLGGPAYGQAIVTKRSNVLTMVAALNLEYGDDGVSHWAEQWDGAAWALVSFSEDELADVRQHAEELAASNRQWKRLVEQLL